MGQDSSTNTQSLSKTALLKPKIAIFYDWLNQYGGAEKVLLDIIKIYPQADLFTLIYDPKKISWLPKNIKITTSILNQLSLLRSKYLSLSPLYFYALEQLDFSNYDLVISTTSTVGHALITSPNTLFLCYLHNINRHIYLNSNCPLMIHNIYSALDKIYSHRPDYLFCNSKTVQKRIQNIYHRDAQVIYPGINPDLYKLPQKNFIRKNFLIVSRLVPYKKIDLAIVACSQLNLPLTIIGQGREERKLKKLAASQNCRNINFLGYVSQDKLIKLYQNSRALICPQEEDFGLSPLEAQSCGCPIIAFNQGGLTETVIDNKTGIFFDQQTPESLMLAIKKFLTLKINSQDCHSHALNFSQESFMLNFKQSVDNLWEKHQKKIIT